MCLQPAEAITGEWERRVAPKVTAHGWSSGFSFVSEYRGRGPSFFPCTNARRLFPVIEDLGKANVWDNDCLEVGVGGGLG